MTVILLTVWRVSAGAELGFSHISTFFSHVSEMSYPKSLSLSVCLVWFGLSVTIYWWVTIKAVWRYEILCGSFLCNYLISLRSLSRCLSHPLCPSVSYPLTPWQFNLITSYYRKWPHAASDRIRWWIWVRLTFHYDMTGWLHIQTHAYNNLPVCLSTHDHVTYPV